MHKGIKILQNVFTTILLSFVILCVLLALALQIPAVQSATVHQITQWLSTRLETTIALDRISITPAGKVRLRGFYVEDYQKDTLLYVDRMEAYVTGLGIFERGVVLRRGVLSGVVFNLHETPEGVMNIKQIVVRIANPNREKKGRFKLTIHTAKVEDMAMRIERRKHRNPLYGIDFWNIRLNDMEARVGEFVLEGPEIRAEVESFRAKEQSGFALEHLSGLLRVNNGTIEMTDALLATEKSRLSIPYLSLQGTSWLDYKKFITTVPIHGQVRRSSLAVSDVAYFSPGLRNKELQLDQVDFDFTGMVDDFTARVRSMRLDRSATVSGYAQVRGLPDFKHTYFNVQIPKLYTTPAEAEYLVRTFSKKPLSKGVASILERSRYADLAVQFRGTPRSFKVSMDARTGAGKAQAQLTMRPQESGLQAIDGHVTAQNLRLGELLGESKLLGDATLNAHIDGLVGRGYTHARVEGTVDKFTFNDYAYDSIRLDGQLQNRCFDGTVTVRDENLDLDFAGVVDFNDSIPDYDFSVLLRHADLVRMNINHRDSVSLLAARMEARASGRSLDDLNGEVRITEGNYRYNNRTLQADSLSIRGVNSDRSKYIELRSDFANATFRSRTSYREAFDYLRRSAYKYLPIPGRQLAAADASALHDLEADNYSMLKVDIRNFNPVADAFSSGLQIADGSSLNMTFNPSTDRLTMRVVSDYIERNRFLATRLNLNARNNGDSLRMSATAEDMFLGGVHLPGFVASGGAKGGRVELTTGFADTAQNFSGRLGVRAGFVEESGADRSVDIRILPSRISRGDDTWQIFARKILIDTARVQVDRFMVTSEGQRLELNGIASHDPQDSLSLQLKNFSLAPISQLISRLGYGVEGRTNGQATMKSALSVGEISADIHIDSLSVNGLYAPPLHLLSRWEPQQSRAGLFVTNRDNHQTLIRGFFIPEGRRYYARMQVDSLQLGLLDPVLNGVISHTGGTASVDLTLRGAYRDAELKGRVDVSDLQTTVEFTQVTYTAPRATLQVEGNRFRTTDVPIFDAQGNRGLLDLALSLQHLSNIAYDVRVRPDNMLVLNTDDEDNDLFYGKVYASGEARIKGDKGKVDMQIAARTEDNSTFFLPMSSKSNISDAEYVTFVKPLMADTTDHVVRKKQSFSKRRRKRASNQMNIAMTLDVQPNAELEMSVSGNTIRARGTGTLNLQINPKSNVFEMYGDYVIREGAFLFSLQNLLTRKFDIVPGSTIQWTGSPLNALLNIDALYKVKASLQPLLAGTSDRLTSDRLVNVECFIRLRDRLIDPTVTFDVRVPSSDTETQALIVNALSTPETMDMQFLYLLLFKSFMSENNAASQNLTNSVSYGTGLEFLANQLSNLLSTSGYDIILRYRPKSELTSDEVDFGLSKGLINNRLFVELEGNYVLDDRRQMNNRTMSNFMGEAFVTYLIDRAGTLKLKAFTQTIDRFDENQGLQETGLGVSYKEDFNNFRDFRQRVKERFTNKKRQARRAARRLAQEAQSQAETPQTE